MSREILNKPHPTPNPDGPHAGGGQTVDRVRERAPRSYLENESVTEELRENSCLDDLNVIMAEPGAAPDPALKSKSSSDTVLQIVPEKHPLSFLGERETEPRTSEIFQSFGSQAADAAQLTAATLAPSVSPLIEISSDREALFERSLVETSESTVKGTTGSRGDDWASDDEQFAESRVPWALIFLMSYSSAVTLALTWVVWTGRSFRPAGASSANVSPADVETVPKLVNSAPVGVLPPLPTDNLASLGRSMQIGDLEVTPLGVVIAPVALIRSIDRNDWRREESASLVLRLRLKNVSRDREFAPLEPRWLREQGAAVDRSAIVTTSGNGINLFPLAVDSEWSIEGQSFNALKPGETVETVVASEPGVADKLTDEMIWHIRLRIGTYRTDVLGVRVNKHEIEEAGPG